MKLIEAMKQKEDLLVKAADLRQKINRHCAYLSYETPTYGTYDSQKDQVRAWLQAHRDILQEVSRLRLAIQRTNVDTEVTIELGGKQVTKTIAEWIVRRGSPKNPGLADLDRQAWNTLGDKNLKEGRGESTEGVTVDIRILRCFDPAERDTMVELFRSEPAKIDGVLEIINAVTDLIE